MKICMYYVMNTGKYTLVEETISENLTGNE